MKERVRKKIAKRKRREVLELLDLAIRKNEGRASVFFSFSGHVNGVTIDIHKNGWSFGNKYDRSMTTYLDSNYGDYSLKEMKHALEVL